MLCGKMFRCRRKEYRDVFRDKKAAGQEIFLTCGLCRFLFFCYACVDTGADDVEAVFPSRIFSQTAFAKNAI